MAAREFDHFVLTRFNVRQSRDQAAPDENWLRNRLKIFAGSLAPAMQSQSVRPDAWLIFIDAGSPTWLAAELRKIAPAAEIISVEVFSPEWLQTEIARMGSRPYLITTRIDNDDSVSRDFLSLVQREFRHQRKQFVNFTDGLQYSAGRLYERSDPHNAFCSLIERRSDRLATVFEDWHNRIHKHGPVLQVPGCRVWMQIVHGANVANRVSGLSAAPASASNFALVLPLKSMSITELLWLRLVDLSRLATRVIARPHRLLWAARVIASRVRPRSA
jgi:hypothetical protein